MRATVVIAALFASACPNWAAAEEVEGFTEPYRQVELAASDTGLIDRIHVREGQGVDEGELVATLDTQVLEASQRIADRHVDSHGKLDSTRSDLKLRQARVDKFRELLGRAHATQEEVDRAAIERDIAAAAVLMAEEENAIRRLESTRIAIQIERRSVRSPIDGIVVERHKEVGEFVSPADPSVMTVVQLNPLRASFNVPRSLADLCTEGREATVRLVDGGRDLTGEIEFVSPVVESESGTMRVRVRIANPDLAIRAGERCVLVIEPVTRVATRPR